jgi:hypothetical protein
MISSIEPEFGLIIQELEPDAGQLYRAFVYSSDKTPDAQENFHKTSSSKLPTSN